MKRSEFTNINSILETEMREAGEVWVNDEWLRSATTQNGHYMKGRIKNEDGTYTVVDEGAVVTQCDGYIKKSNHQYGTAVDKYFVKDGNIVYDITGHDDLKDKYIKWHDRAVALGLKPLIVFKNGTADYPHFEG